MRKYRPEWTPVFSEFLSSPPHIRKRVSVVGLDIRILLLVYQTAICPDIKQINDMTNDSETKQKATHTVELLDADDNEVNS